VLLEVLAERAYPPEDVGRLRIAWCARPEGRPVDEAVAVSTLAAMTTLERLGHDVVACDLPLAGWREAFEPLVLDEEWRELTSYEMGSLRNGRDLTPEAVEHARQALAAYRDRIARLFDSYDLLCTPAVATPAFPVGRRPTEIGGQDVDPLWGAFPFAVPFNVACTSAASVPCGLVDGLPVGLQIVGPRDADRLVLSVAEALESALAFDAAPVLDRWMSPRSADGKLASRPVG
jgi:Asp-tRNA(Asn)/Glu-tRNA(Gln) amidotransferase A subunit family amidase